MTNGLRTTLLAAACAAMLLGGCTCTEEADKTASDLTGEKAI